MANPNNITQRPDDLSFLFDNPSYKVASATSVDTYINGTLISTDNILSNVPFSPRDYIAGTMGDTPVRNFPNVPMSGKLSNFVTVRCVFHFADGDVEHAFVCFRGSLPKLFYLKLNAQSTNAKTYFENKFLTLYPTDKVTTTKTREFLYWYNFQPSPVSVFFRVTATFASQTVKTYNTTAITLNANELIYFAATFNEIVAASDWGSFWNNPLSYTVQLFYDDLLKNPITEPYKYVCVTNVSANFQQFVFQNHFGLWEGFFSHELISGSFSVENSFLPPVFGNSLLLLDSYIQKMIRNDVTETFIANLGFYPKAAADCLMQYLNSPQAFEVADDYIVLPIRIRKASVALVQFYHQISFEYEK